MSLYKESQFESLTQPEGFKKWAPGVDRISILKSAVAMFKVFIPPGASSLSVMTNCGQDAGNDYAFVARLDQIPSGPPLPGGYNQGFSSIALAQKDCSGSNYNGYIYILKGGVETKGRWLYVVIDIIQGNITNTKVGFSITDKVAYANWYNSVAWDAMGDPIQGGVVVPTPPVPPSPPPVPVPVDTVIEIKVQKGQLYKFIWD